MPAPLANRPILPAATQTPTVEPAVAGTPVSPSAGVLLSTYKRPIVQAACRQCREKKIKCNDARPECNNCLKRGVACVWDTGPGQSRSVALKDRSARNEKELGAFLELHWYIKNRPRNDGVNVEEILRSEGNPQACLDILKRLDASTGGAAWSPPADASVKRVQSAHVLTPAATASPAESHFVSPWDRDLIRAAANAFIGCIGIMFPVYDRQEIEDTLLLLDTLPSGYGLDDTLAEIAESDPKAPLLAQVAAVTAIGMCYLHNGPHVPKYPGIPEDQYPQYSRHHYEFARSCLDRCIKEDPLKAMKITALLAMWNIIDNSSVALAYTDMGIAVGSRYDLAAGSQSVKAEDVSYHKTFRTLIMIRGWLSATLIESPSTCAQTQMQALLDTQGADSSDVNEVLQRELARVTVIKAHILEVTTKLDILSPVVLQTLKKDLLHWHDQLPSWLSFGSLLDPAQEFLALDQVCVGCYMHMFYLAAVALKTRVLLSALADVGPEQAKTQSLITPAVEDALQDGLFGARVCAKILGMLYERKFVFPKCWLCIFSSYCTALTLAYAHIQRLITDQPVVPQDLELATTCRDVLGFCAKSAPTAAILFKQAQVVFDQLPTGNAPAQPISSADVSLVPLSGSSALHTLSADTLDLLCKPFAGGNAKLHMKDTVISIEEICVGGHLNWCSLFPRPSEGQERDLLAMSPLEGALPMAELDLKERALGDMKGARNGDERGSHGWSILSY